MFVSLSPVFSFWRHCWGLHRSVFCLPRYSSAGRSLLEPLMQRYWEWLVGRVPSWIAPNLITIIGLATNVFTTLVLVYYCPTATEQVFQPMSLWTDLVLKHMKHKANTLTRRLLSLSELLSLFQFTWQCFAGPGVGLTSAAWLTGSELTHS